MKVLFIVVICCFSSIVCFSQFVESKFNITESPDFYISQYKISYEIKDLDTATLEIIDAIDFKYYEQFRLQNFDVEIYDENTSQILILYSDEKVKLKNKKKSPGLKNS